MLALMTTLACFAPKTFPEDDLPLWEERPVIGTYGADVDMVWEATVEVIGEISELDVTDRTTGHITTNWIRDKSDTIYTTYGGTRIPSTVRWRMTVDVRRVSGSTEVQITSQEQVEKDMISANLEFTGSIYKWIDVPSSMAKERVLLEKILLVVDRKKNGGGYDDYDYAQ
jgi:hypothetical protein